MEIYLLTGPINSGKTTRLAAWCATQNGVAGLLSPKQPEGRTFQSIRTSESRKMEAGPEEKQVQEVGRYRFSADAFKWANQILPLEAESPETIWLIIDEIGPLELRGFGLDPALKQILSLPEQTLKLVLVVRETLLEEVIEYYKLSRFPIFCLEI